jgi:hypothetical protein
MKETRLASRSENFGHTAAEATAGFLNLVQLNGTQREACPLQLRPLK